MLITIRSVIIIVWALRLADRLVHLSVPPSMAITIATTSTIDINTTTNTTTIRHLFISNNTSLGRTSSLTTKCAPNAKFNPVVPADFMLLIIRRYLRKSVRFTNRTSISKVVREQLEISQRRWHGVCIFCDHQAAIFGTDDDFDGRLSQPNGVNLRTTSEYGNTINQPSTVIGTLQFTA